MKIEINKSVLECAAREFFSSRRGLQVLCGAADAYASAGYFLVNDSIKVHATTGALDSDVGSESSEGEGFVAYLDVGFIVTNDEDGFRNSGTWKLLTDSFGASLAGVEKALAQIADESDAREQFQELFEKEPLVKQKMQDCVFDSDTFVHEAERISELGVSAQ